MKTKIFICLLFSTLLLYSQAFAVNIDIAFFPNDTITVAEGSTVSDTVTFNDTQVNSAPIAFYVDTTGFASAVYDTLRQGNDRLTRISFTISPGFSDAGNYYGIDLIAYDANGADTSATLWINVTNTPRAPQLINLPDTIFVNEGNSASFQIAAYDPDDDISVYRINPSNLSWVTFDSVSGGMDIGPVPYDIATWRNPQFTQVISVSVVDGGGRSDSAPLSVIVQNIDRPPHFTNPSRDTLMTVYQNIPGSLHFRATDPDFAEGDTARFFDSDNLRNYLQGEGWTVSFTDSILNFTPPAGALGLARPSGFRVVAARSVGAPADTVVINFNVIDTIPPGQIAPFTGSSADRPFGVIRLQWDAPHEDGTAGGAASFYMIRYATTAPGGNPETWWGSAQNITEQPPVPASPGTSQHLDIAGRIEYQPYWFGIKSVDSSGNISAVAVTGQIFSRQVPPAIYLLGDSPDTVRADSVLHFTGVAADSGGIIQSVRYQAGTSNWSNVSMDSTSDSSAVFIRKYFHFAQPAGSGTSITVQVRAHDSQDSTTIAQVVYIDNTRPARPVVQSDPADSLTSDNSFVFTGTKDRDAVVYQILTLGQNPGPPVRLTAPGDNRTSWSHSEVVYYQGAVTFQFYCLDNAGNVSDTTRLPFWLVLSQEPPNVINPDSVDYHNSTVFHPISDSFMISFPYSFVSQFDMSILNRMGTVVYSITDSLASAPGRYTAYWNGVMNSGPDIGECAPDGRYLAKFSARTYPVSPFDIPIQVELILDSYAPYELSLFPQAGGNTDNPRIINNATVFSLVVGDTGSISLDSRAEIVPPYLIANSTRTLTFNRVDSIPGTWTLDLASSAPLSSGRNLVSLVISDAAGNQSTYSMIFEVTEAKDITGFVNYPNPFAPSQEDTKITFVLGEAVNDLTLEIFDSAGDIVFRQALDASFLTPQAHEFSWNGRSLWGKKLNNGVYFARLTGGITTDFLKIAIVDR